MHDNNMDCTKGSACARCSTASRPERSPATGGATGGAAGTAPSAAAAPGAGAPWLRTNGVDTNKAAAKVIHFDDKLRKKYALALLGI